MVQGEKKQRENTRNVLGMGFRVDIARNQLATDWVTVTTDTLPSIYMQTTKYQRQKAIHTGWAQLQAAYIPWAHIISTLIHLAGCSPVCLFRWCTLAGLLRKGPPNGWRQRKHQTMCTRSHWQPQVNWIAAARCPGCSKVSHTYSIIQSLIQNDH